MKYTILATHEGWFLFCPIYWSEPEQELLAKRNLGWLLDLALEIQQFRNWCLSFVGIDGGFPLSLTKLQAPKIVFK